MPVFNILCVAKFMEHKGQHLLVEAFDTLLNRNPELAGRVKLSLRGFHNDRDYFERIKKQVADSRFAEFIHFVPFNPDERTEQIYAEADLVVLLSAYEGFGLPVLEAQSRGVPVLCSDLPVLREVGGGGAAYVERADASACADAMRRFIEDPEFRSRMKKRALENVDRFSWKRAAEQTLEAYN